jgi:hypothetical protein
MVVFYDLRGKELDFDPVLASRHDLESVDLEEGRLLKFNLRVKSVGEVVKVKTASFGSKDFLEVILVGEDDDYEIVAEAWASHCATFLKLCSVDTVFNIAFHAKPKGASMFLEQREWRIRLNSEVKIKDCEPIQKSKKRPATRTEDAKTPSKLRRTSLKKLVDDENVGAKSNVGKSSTPSRPAAPQKHESNGSETDDDYDEEEEETTDGQPIVLDE